MGVRGTGTHTLVCTYPHLREENNTCFSVSPHLAWRETEVREGGEDGCFVRVNMHYRIRRMRVQPTLGFFFVVTTV